MSINKVDLSQVGALRADAVFSTCFFPPVWQWDGLCCRQRPLCQPGLGSEAAIGAEPQPMFESLESRGRNTTLFSATEIFEAVWCVTLSTRSAKEVFGMLLLISVAFTLHGTKVILVSYS